MNRKRARAIGLFAIGAVVAAGGCSGPKRGGEATTRPAGTGATLAQPVQDEWPPLDIPGDFDRDRATLPLAKVPGDPPAPAAAGKVVEAEMPRQALQRIEEARRLFAEQRYSETSRELERALRYNVDSYEAYRLLAIAALRSGDFERAQSSADKALTLKPDDSAARYVQARVSEMAGQKDAALAQYRTAIKCPATDGDAPYRLLTAYYLSNLLFDAGYYAAGIEQASTFENGLRTLGAKANEDPELAALVRAHRTAAMIRLARAYGLLGDHAQAAAALRVAVEQSPKDNALRTEYIYMLGRAKRLDDAATEAARFAADTDGAKAAVDLLLTACRRAGHPERALAVMRQLATAQPDNTELWKRYIDALSAAGQFDEALAALNDFVAKHPDAIDTRWRLIQLTRERGDWPTWFNALVQHLQSQPQDQPRVSAELQRLPKDIAERLVAEANQPATQRKLLPPRPTADLAASATDTLLAEINAHLGHVEQARALCSAAFQRTPDFAPAMIGAAEQPVATCRWQEAIDLLEAHAKAQTTPSAHLESLLGQCYDGLDEIDKALEHYQQALKLDDRAVDTMLRLGRLYERGRRGKDATALYQKAIAAEPDNMPARELLVRNLLTQAAQDGRSAARLVNEVKDMQQRAPEDPATIRAGALAELVTKGADGRKPYLETLRKLVHGRPNEIRGREDLVAILLAMREYAEASDQANQLIRLDPYSSDAGELVGVAELRMLNLPAAAAQLDRTLKYYPNRESLLARRAQIALIMQDYSTAIQCYNHLLEVKYLAGQREAYRNALVQAYIEAGQIKEGRGEVESWLVVADNDTERLIVQSYLLNLDAAAGDVDGFVAHVREWLKADPEDEYLRRALIGGEYLIDLVSGRDLILQKPMGLIGQKHYEEATLLALRWMEEGLLAPSASRDQRSQNLRLVDRVLAALQAAGRHDEAIELARGQVAANPAGTDEHGMAVLILRTVYLRADRIDAAIEATQELVSSDQNDRLEAQRLVSLLSRAGQHEEAVAQVKKQLSALDEQRTRIEEFAKRSTDPRQQAAIRRALDEVNPRKAFLLRTLSYAYQRMGQDDVARTRLEEAYELDPTEIGTNNDLGYLLADKGGDLDQAERMVRIALAEEPRQAAYQDSYAWVLYKRGDLQGAKTWLLRATAMEEGQDPVVYDHLADVQWRLGEQDAAIKSWRQSIQAHADQLRRGEAEMEKGILERVQTKLRAAEAGGKPEIAPLAAKSQPAP